MKRSAERKVTAMTIMHRSYSDNQELYNINQADTKFAAMATSVRDFHILRNTLFAKCLPASSARQRSLKMPLDWHMRDSQIFHGHGASCAPVGGRTLDSPGSHFGTGAGGRFISPALLGFLCEMVQSLAKDSTARESTQRVRASKCCTI